MSCLALPTSDAAAVAVQTDRRRVFTRHILRLIHPLPVLLRVTTSSRDNITGGGGDFDVADRIDPFFPALHLPETFGIVPPLGGQRVSSSSLPYRGVNNFLHDNLTGSPGSGVQVGGETVIESVFFFLLFLFLSCSLSSSQERPISRGKRRSFSPSLKKNNPAGVRCSVPGERKGGRNSKRLFLFRREIIYPASSSLSIRPSVYLSISFLALLLGEKQIPRPAGRRENSRRSAHRRWCTHNRGSLSL